tara:strand:- start:65 stop:202 length:138 start_codon:yes stop_codon:yes gene_type:complete
MQTLAMRGDGHILYFLRLFQLFVLEQACVIFLKRKTNATEVRNIK